MTFSELREAIRKISSREVSVAVDYYLETVVVKVRFGELTELFENYFGPPLKPAGCEATEQVCLVAGRYGGVRDQQILYARAGEIKSEVALIWPWASGEQFTVKLIRS